MKRILVSEAGGTLTRNFVSSVRTAPEKYYIIGISSNIYELPLSNADENYLVPPARNPKFIPVLNRIIKKTRAEFLHSQHDKVIKVLSRNASNIQTSMFLPNPQTIERCIDKFKSYEAWSAHGVATPKTMLIQTKKDLKRAFDELGSTIWLRLREGGGGAGSCPARNLNFATLWIDYFNGWGRFTAAEMLSPHSVTWSSIWKNGTLVVAQSRKRLHWLFGNRTLSGVTGVTGVAETVSDPQIDKLAQKAILALDASPNGIFSVDITYDRRGKPKLTEINIGRFFTTIDFFTKAGLNMPYMYLKTAFGEPIPKLNKRINPLPNHLLWIRGMDTAPVLTTTKKIEHYRKNV